MHPFRFLEAWAMQNDKKKFVQMTHICRSKTVVHFKLSEISAYESFGRRRSLSKRKQKAFFVWAGKNNQKSQCDWLKCFSCVLLDQKMLLSENKTL